MFKKKTHSKPEVKKSTFSKLADEFKETVKPKPATVVSTKPVECKCCKAGCTCCDHLSGTVGHRCLCRCHS